MAKKELKDIIKDKMLLKKALRKASSTDFAKIQRKMWKEGLLLKGEYLTKGIDY